MQTNKPVKELDLKLNRHFLACSAFVGTALVVSVQNADASIVYSGAQNLSVPTTNGAGGIYIDLTLPGSPFIPTGSGTGNAEGLGTLLPNWTVNFYGSSSGTGSLRWAYQGSSGAGTQRAEAVYSGIRVAPLTSGTLIDSSSLFGTYQTLGSTWSATTAYMGIRFKDSGDNLLYGWIQIQAGSPNGLPATIVDWAYENTGAGLDAGELAPVPEPTMLALGCLSAGAVGLMAWRKKRKAN